jgi:hypothetical protein
MAAPTKLSDLTPDPKNARRRTPESSHLIKESLQRYGAARSVVVDENNMLIAGHGTVEAAKELGINKVRVIETDGDELIAVKRTNWSPDQKIGANLADNRTSDLSEWDAEMLQSLSEETDVSPWFSEDDINELLGFEEDPADDQSDQVMESFQIMIQCKNEAEQSASLETLINQGFKCRALNS